jgi:hypothetical protein
MKGVKSIAALEKGDLLIAIANVTVFTDTDEYNPNLASFTTGQTLGAVVNPNFSANGSNFVSFVTVAGNTLYLPKTSLNKVKSKVNLAYEYPSVGTTTGGGGSGKKWWEVVLETAGAIVPAVLNNGKSTQQTDDSSGGGFTYDTETGKIATTEDDEKKQKNGLVVIVVAVVVVIGGLVIWLIVKKKPATKQSTNSK